MSEKFAVSPMEFSIKTSLCLNTTYKLIREGRLHAVRVDRKLLIPMTSVEAFLQGNPPEDQTAK
jgi:excisionase family DNA binding protein